MRAIRKRLSSALEALSSPGVSTLTTPMIIPYKEIGSSRRPAVVSPQAGRLHAGPLLWESDFWSPYFDPPCSIYLRTCEDQGRLSLNFSAYFAAEYIPACSASHSGEEGSTYISNQLRAFDQENPIWSICKHQRIYSKPVPIESSE
jgi:hypothetical protein